MKILTDLVARILCAVPIMIFGLFHFMAADDMAAMAPFGGAIMVYITGIPLILAGVAILIKKKAALAALLLGVFLILTATSVHLRSLMGGDEMAMGQVLKDLALAGASFFMAGVFGKEEEQNA